MDTVCFSFGSGHVIHLWELHVLLVFLSFLVVCVLCVERQFFNGYLCTERRFFKFCIQFVYIFIGVKFFS